ncbi:MAG TPA: AMP-binding protein [Solirubrobacterales bacterium]|nr:AMP-binding protein [Solirubrobacterales bacterium]
MGALRGDELFDRAVRERAGDRAFLYFDTAIGVGEAAARARALAAALRGELGLRAGDRVALMLQNVPQFPIAVHAVWRCGGVVTAVNPMNKERELRHQLTDSGARIVVCLESLYGVVAAARDGTAVEHVITVSELDLLDKVPAALAGHERIECPGALSFAELTEVEGGGEAAEVSPDAPALITYTSGTTGLPKGAINTHRAVIHNAEAMRDWGSLGPGDVTVAMAPLFHITGLVCHMSTARASRTPLLLLYRFDAGEILRLIERWRGSYVIGPLTAFIAMLDHPEIGGRDLSSLTKVGSGGAPVYASVVERWEAATGAYMHNTYGLTETAAPSHLVPFGTRAPVDPETGALSVGKPIADTESRVVAVDGGGETAAGEEGEILTRGPGVTPGYWQRPEETAAAIEDGWLHTGDVGKRDADGWFYLVDRIKDMINVSGYKVWPREVEDVLFTHPALAEASVIGAPDSYRGEVPVAYVVLRAGAVAGEDEVIAHCRERLAVYKAPRRVVFVAEIPKTLTGKALRRELRQREQCRKV